MNTCGLSITMLTNSESEDHHHEKEIDWDKVKTDLFFHIYVTVEYFNELEEISARVQKVDILGEPLGTEKDLFKCKKVSWNQFVLTSTHYSLDATAYYTIRIADNFDGFTRCLITQLVKVENSI